MAGPKILPKGHQVWPAKYAAIEDAAQIQALYEAGFAGCYGEPEEEDRLKAEIEAAGGSLDGETIAHAMRWADSAAGQLVSHFTLVDRGYPGGWPGPNQIGGSCVGQSTKNRDVYTVVCEVAAGLPDEITGLIEGLPEVSPQGIQAGIFAPETNYWYRGYNGDGWSCAASARVTLNKSGCCWPRANYPELGIDLTSYTRSNQYKYGSRPPPQEYVTHGLLHEIRTMTQVREFEAVRDFLANGYGITSCGSEGFSSSRNADGVSSRRGSWSHAMAYIGADDRQETKAKYGGPLVLVLNSWGRWNSGPRTVMGTSIEIPEGSFWARWSDVSRRSAYAASSVEGWPARKLPDLGTGGFL